MPQARPLDGIRVLEVGQLLAGPFTGTLLAYFGAEVIKVEPRLTGDPVRTWRMVDNGTSVWWRSLGRNKKCLSVDLRRQEGRDLVRRIADHCDVVIENFKPGRMEKWGLGPEELKANNPGLVYTRISGYGQTGPYAPKPGYASVCEGVGGFRFLNGFPDLPPVRPNLSLGDSLAGLHAAFGVLLALYHRDRDRSESASRGPGQVIDVAIYEAVFNMMESVLPEYDRFGEVRQREGATLSGIVPTNTYLCRDGQYVIIGGNGDSIYKRLMRTAGRDDLADDPRLADNAGRVTHRELVDGAIAEWTAALDAPAVVENLEQAQVPVGRLYDIADIAADPHYKAREMFEEVEVDGRPLKIPAIVPKLTETPGRTDWPGPSIGAHRDEVLGELLGLSRQEIDRLAAGEVI
jgi:crotonobetainyl-CoA:carnitine CoA-transferase CaiB-like acyl-CoA transferase